MPFRVEYADDSAQVDQENPVFHAQPDESYLGTLARGIPRAAARTVEAGIGLPKAIGEGVQSLAHLASRGARAITPDIIQKVIEFDPAVSLGLKSAPTPEDREFPLGREIPFLPSAETAKEYITEPLSQLATGKKGALEPQSKREEFIDEVISDAVPFLFGTGKLSVPGKVARALGVSGAGNLAKFGAKSFGLGEAAGNVLKAGTMFATSLMGSPSSKDYAQNLYKEAETNIPESSLVDFKPIDTAMNAVRSKMKRGATKGFDDAKKFVREFFAEVDAKVKPANTIEIKELPAFKKLYNQKFGDNKVPKGAKSWMHDFFKSYDEAYKTAPESILSEIDKMKTADNIYTALNAQNKVEKFISNNKLLNNIFKKGSKFSGLGFLFNPKASLGALGGFQLYDTMEKIATYPGLQKRYADVFKSLLKEDPTAVAKNISLFSKEYDKKSAPKPSQGKFRVVSI